MIVVDPRPTALARQADVWLPVRPGTDAALALGLMHLLITQARYDTAFVHDWTNAPLLVRADSGDFLRERELWPQAQHDRFVVWDDTLQAAVPYDTRQAAADQGGGFRLRGEFRLMTESGAALICHPVFELLAAAGLAPGRRSVRVLAPHCLSRLDGDWSAYQRHPVGTRGGHLVRLVRQL